MQGLPVRSRREFVNDCRRILCLSINDVHGAIDDSLCNGYADTTAYVRRSQFMSFVYYQEFYAGSVKPEEGVRWRTVREWAFFLADQGFAPQTIHSYLVTAVDTLINLDLLSKVQAVELKVKRLKITAKAKAMRLAPSKARVIQKHRIRALSALDRSIAMIWILLGARRMTFSNIQQTDVEEVKDGRGRLRGLKIYFKSLKFVPKSGMTHGYICCNCFNNAGVADAEFCPIHNMDLTHNIFPVGQKKIDSVLHKLRATGHSPRRTLALALRRLMVAGKVTEQQICTIMYWSSKQMLKEYTVDWITNWRDTVIPVCRGAIQRFKEAWSR